MPPPDEIAIAELLAELPPAPAAWVTAAQEAPALRAELDGLISRARADADTRVAILADLEAALDDAGVDPRPGAVPALRAWLSDG